MPVTISDFVTLPKPFKYLVFVGLLIGASITIPFIGISLGDIFFVPLGIIFNALGIFINFQLFVVLVIIVLAIFFMNKMDGGG